MKDIFKKRIRLGITHGDINGISYEIIIKTLIDPRILDLCIPIVYGSPKIAAYHRKTLNIMNFSFNHIKRIEELHPKRPNIVNCVDDNIRVELGKPSEAAGEAAFSALERAVIDLKEKKIDVLVTAPINKHNIYSDKFQFPGHTEYFIEQFGSPKNALMLMVSDIMKLGLVTGHVPLKDVPKYITKENILNKLRVMHKTLLQDFAIRKPQIAVLGLNPHSGDRGIIGNEEEEIIKPAINAARNEGIMAIGPFPSDGFFGSSTFGKFDAILAMYHDQGLAPFKALSFDEGINYTAGLPIIRTSPAHGTAYEIAGAGKAKPDSFRQAMYMACDIFNNRNQYKEISKNPLPVGSANTMVNNVADEDISHLKEE